MPTRTARRTSTFLTGVTTTTFLGDIFAADKRRRNGTGVHFFLSALLKYSLELVHTASLRASAPEHDQFVARGYVPLHRFNTALLQRRSIILAILNGSLLHPYSNQSSRSCTKDLKRLAITKFRSCFSWWMILTKKGAEPLLRNHSS